MSNGTLIVKRNGNKEHLNIDKIHFVVDHACKGLAGVSSSQIEMNANLQFYDGMSTVEIQEVLIRSANDLISLDAVNYQFAAARLLSYSINKEVFAPGIHDHLVVQHLASEVTLENFALAGTDVHRHVLRLRPRRVYPAVAAQFPAGWA